MLKEKMTTKNILIAVVLLVVALLSFTVITKYATSAEVHNSSLQLLDDKKMTAMELTAGVAATSTAISALPGDAATPIAEQVADLTGPLLLVICAIYLEKFLLTTIGFISFKILIPLACLLGIGYLFLSKESIRIVASKMAVFALVIAIAIPASVSVTKLIETTFEESIQNTYEEANVVTEEAEKSNEQEESKGFMNFLKGLGDEVTELADSARNALSVFIDAIAVLLITTCVIPILVILFFLWMIKLIFGLNIIKKSTPGGGFFFYGISLRISSAGTSSL